MIVVLTEKFETGNYVTHNSYALLSNIEFQICSSQQAICSLDILWVQCRHEGHHAAKMCNFRTMKDANDLIDSFEKISDK